MSYAQKVARAHKQLIQIRKDPTKTEARYDEIIELRMLLLDILETTIGLELPELNDLTVVIQKRAAKWGLKGDCV